MIVVMIITKNATAGNDAYSMPFLKNMQAGPVQFVIGAQARVRYEHFENYTIKGYRPGDDDDMLLERVRLDFSATFFESLRVFLQFQDAHSFLTKYDNDDFPKSSPIEDTMDIRQLYFECNTIGGIPLGFRMGRQQISYGDQRVFGPGSWGNTGRYAWDAAMVKGELGPVWADVWVGRNIQYKSDTWPNRGADGFITLVAYSGIKYEHFRFDIFYVYKNDEHGAEGHVSGDESIRSHSAGFQTEIKSGKAFDASLTLIRQSGSYGNENLRAYGANVRAGITAPVSWKPRIGGQITWGSGDSDPDDGVRETFDGLYGGKDIYFYGCLNLFTWSNIRDHEINFSVHPFENVTAFVDYHYFTLDEARDAWYTTGMKEHRRDKDGVSGVVLGHEIDVRLAFTICSYVEIMAGFGRMFPGEFIRNTGSAETASWGFFQTTFTI
jgi:hypothetical protein